jgi:hypothetical protein
MKSLRILAASMAVLAALAVATPAKADSTHDYYLNFALTKGGTFAGTVDFSSNYQSITSLSGIITGYQDGVIGYDKSVPTGTDLFSATSNGLYTSIGGTKEITIILEDTPWSVPIIVFGHKIGRKKISSLWPLMSIMPLKLLLSRQD